MTVTWNKDPIGAGLLMEIIGDDGAGNPITLRYCDEEMFPQGFTDDDALFYEPRITAGLRVAEDMGSVSVASNNNGGVAKQSLEFKLRVAGYDDNIWADLNGTRLEQAEVFLRARDRETGDEEYIFRGILISELKTFRPASVLPFKATAGPVRWTVPYQYDVWLEDEIRGDYLLAGLDEGTQQGQGLGVGKRRPICFGDGLTVEAMQMGRTWHAGSVDVGPLANAARRAICPSTTKFDQTVGNITVWTVGTDNVGTTHGFDDVCAQLATTNAADNDYVNLGRSGAISTLTPYIEAASNVADHTTFAFNGAFFRPGNNEDHRIYAKCDFNGNDIPEIIDWIMFDASGYLGLTTTARNTAGWAAFIADVGSAVSSAYIVTFCAPHVTEEGRVDVKESARDFVAECMRWIGGDAWVEYASDGDWDWKFEIRDWSAASAITIGQHEIASFSLGIEIDDRDYANVIEAIMAERFLYAPGPGNVGSPRTASEVGPILGFYGQTYFDSAEISNLGEKRIKVENKWISADQLTDTAVEDIIQDRLDEVAQEHFLYTWKEPHSGMRRRLHDIIQFDSDDFPAVYTNAAQIRKKISRFGPGGVWTVEFKASPVTGVYNA